MSLKIFSFLPETLLWTQGPLCSHQGILRYFTLLAIWGWNLAWALGFSSWPCHIFKTAFQTTEVQLWKKPKALKMIFFYLNWETSWYRKECSFNLFKQMIQKGMSVKQMKASPSEADRSSCATGQAPHEKLWPLHRRHEPSNGPLNMKCCL